MKKRRGARKTSKTTESHRRIKSFSNKKFLTISIIAFFVFAFVLNFVSVPRARITTGALEDVGTDYKKFISDMFASWKGAGQLDVNVAKYILWFTILAFIMGLFAFLDFPPSKILRFLISLGISFLTIAYLTPGEIYTILVSYSALGLTLGVLFPFMAINLASAMLLSAEKISKLNVGKIMSEIALWILWVCFLGYRLIRIWIDRGAISFFREGTIIVVAIFVLSFLILIFNNRYRDAIFNLGTYVFRKKRERERVMEEEEVKTRSAKLRAIEEEGEKRPWFRFRE